MVGNILIFLWGLAEATLFFIVPDVGLSILALKDRRSGIVACLYAVAGALVGGAIMYYWGRADIDGANRILEAIPAIRPTDIERVTSDLQKLGGRALFFGPLMGIPYKIYAANAHLFMSIGELLLISIPARIIRFLLIAITTPYAAEKVLPHASTRRRIQAVLLFWILFYIGFFIVKGG